MVETTLQPILKDHGSRRQERKHRFLLATPVTKSFAFILILQICNFPDNFNFNFNFGFSNEVT